MSLPEIQIALDVTEAQTAISLGRQALAAGATWLEIGKPLIEFEGIHGCRRICQEFEDQYLLMDLMIIAAPERYVAAASALGVSNVTVMGLAPEFTIEAAIDSGRRHRVDVTIDLFNVSDPVQAAISADRMGADYVMVHFGVDQKRERPQGSPIADLRRVVDAVNIPVAYATYDADESVAAVNAGASVIVQGAPLITTDDPEAAIREFITVTHGRQAP